MAAPLVQVYRKSANGQIMSLYVSVDEAEQAVARHPFAWSRSSDPKSFAKWPWPPERGRGEPVELPSIAFDG
jgi:hypothetical protein